MMSGPETSTATNSGVVARRYAIAAPQAEAVGKVLDVIASEDPQQKRIKIGFYTMGTSAIQARTLSSAANCTT